MIYSGLIEGEALSGVTEQAISTAIRSGESGIKTLYISTELDGHTFISKCIHQVSGIDPYQMHKGQSKDDEAKILNALKYIKNLPITFVNILPPNGLTDNSRFASDVIATCNTGVNKLDIGHIIVDRVPNDIYHPLSRVLKDNFIIKKSILLTLVKQGIKGTPLHFEPFPLSFQQFESENNNE